ncbi:MAG: outer membrane beta-barrel protein [Thermodesulfobacteriota bacterium]
MSAHRMTNGLKMLAFTLLLFSFPAVAFADWEDILAKFRPRITAQEQYLDNIFYTNTNRISDYITTISPGLTFSTSPSPIPFSSSGAISSSGSGLTSFSTERKEVKYGLDLDYSPGFNFYAHNSNLNYVSQTGTLNTWYTFGQHLTVKVWEYFIRSENPWENYVTSQPQPPGVYYLGTNQTLAIYTRNIFEPSLTYQFGREDRFELTFQDMTYYNTSPTIEDYRLDSLTPRLTYWFDIHNGIILEYRFLNADYQISPDFTSQHARGRYTYRFNPQTSIFGEYTFDTVNYESPGVNYYVQNPSVGITQAFSPTLNGRAQVGYFWQVPQTGNTASGPSFDVGINQRTTRTTYDLAFRGGYQYVFGTTAGSTGFTKYYQSIGSITHQLATRLSVGIQEWVGRYDFVQQNDQIDWIWQVEGNVSYQLFRWLTASFIAYHRQDNSSVSTASYKANTAMLRLTATYW